MSSMTVLPPGEDGYVRKKWSVRECRFLVENGLLEPGKFELIQGEIVSKMGQGRLHVAAITVIIEVLAAIFGMKSIQCQAQIGIGELDPFNDPEPDVAVLEGCVSDYKNREPDPATEVLLVVEASNTTLSGDRSTKAQLYAENGVREYWIVSISAQQVIVHRSPTSAGYSDVQTLSSEECVVPVSRPDQSIPVSSLLV